MHGNKISDQTAEQAEESLQYYKDAEKEEKTIKLKIEALCDSWNHKGSIGATEETTLIDMIDALRNLKIQTATPENTGTEKLPSIREALESLEEIKDGRKNNVAMKQVIHTLIDETPKEEKKQRLIALLKSKNETVERIADKKAYKYYNTNTRQILNEIVNE